MVKEVDLRPTGYQAAWVRTPSAPYKPFAVKQVQKGLSPPSTPLGTEFGATFKGAVAPFNPPRNRVWRNLFPKGWGLMELGYLFAEKLYHSTLIDLLPQSYFIDRLSVFDLF